MFFYDTIAAIATPMGEGGIGIIRISGPDAQKIGKQILRTSKGNPFQNFEDHRLYHGLVADAASGKVLDEVLFFFLQKPRSFTAEDTLEIQGHGGTFIMAQILELVLNNGARLAEPGEFTKRAFLNGRIDLIQAESIIDLIRAKTDNAQQLALAQLQGQSSQKIHSLEGKLYQILIAIEALLDFPEEGIPELQRESILKQVSEIQLELEKLLASYDEGRKLREGILVVIAGRPNVGKSSLLNAFLKEERAIVTDIPGTTRDIIEAQFQLRGVPFKIIDTAGIRETDNPIEQIGIAKAEAAIVQADLVLFILDGSLPLTSADFEIASKMQGKQRLIIINKTDLPQQLHREQLETIENNGILEISLLNPADFQKIENAMIDLLGIGRIALDDRPLLSRVRHKTAINQAIEYLSEFENGLSNNRSEDLLAIDLRAALAAIAEITGKNVSAEVLHGIFDQFCIGK